MATPRRFSDEQVERANRVDVVEYARSMGFEITKSGNWYKAKGQGGLYFNRPANTWHWETEDAGGVGAVSLCMKLENKTWIEAVKTLLNEDMEPIRHTSTWKPEPETPKEFTLPDANNTYKHMTAYLTKTRGIEPSVLKAMIDRKYVYENTKKSCVFVGRDKEGNARHASVRSTNTMGKVFKQDVPGSQKAYSFNIPGDSGILNVFEAPIDLLSYVSLQKVLGKQTRDSYLALGGTTDKALERFLHDYPDIQKIRVCTDNDKLLNAEWDNASTNKTAFIRNTNVVKGKETDLQILFRTCNDYSRFIERNPEAETYYFSLSKDKLRFADNGDLYAFNLVANEDYVLYKTINDFENGKGFVVSGKELYEKYLYEMPAGEKAAVRIHERYGHDYKVTRHRPTHKDFNEDIIALRQQMIKEQNNIKKQNEQSVYKKEPKTEASQNKEQLFRDKLIATGIDEQLVDWYDKHRDIVCLDESGIVIKGSSSYLVVCDNPVDTFAYIQSSKERAEASQYEIDNHYLAFRDVEQVKTYLEENPQIYAIGVATSKTEIGENAYKQLQSLEHKELFVARMEPKFVSYTQDIKTAETIDNAIEQTPINELQTDVAVGMEPG